MPKYIGNMGQICINGTDVINKVDDGAPNQQIPKPGLLESLNENPTIAYGTALVCCLTWIYNLHIEHPTKDVLLLPDNISSAFHQLFYNPCMMPVFTLVFDMHLCILAGTIFGSCSSPTFYMLPGELHTWLAGALNFQDAQSHLVD